MLKHMANDRIVLDQKAITLDLARGMAIADMPRELDKIASDFQQWLGSCYNFDHLIVGQCKCVASDPKTSCVLDPPKGLRP